MKKIKIPAIFLIFSLFLFSCATNSNKNTVNGKPINPYKENTALYFGNPSGAIHDITKSTDYLMEKKQYTLSYNNDTLCSNWVAWHLDSTDLGETDRTDAFKSDSELPEEWYAVKHYDYNYSKYGFDRGHICPSADRTASKEDNEATFLMTNMVPQSPDNNRIIWMHFENYERKMVEAGNELYIIAGPYGTGGKSQKGYFEKIEVMTRTKGTCYINIPAYTWKICLVIPEGTDDFERVNESTTVIAINVPNEMGMKKTGDWEQYITTVDEIEKLTGMDFFNLLPDDIENKLEAGIYRKN